MLGKAGAPILVGTDGSPAATAAVRWAAREAMVRRRPLRIVHAFDRIEPERDGTAEVSAAVRSAQAVAPGVAMSGTVEFGHPGPVLAGLSKEAIMLVVGTRSGAGPLGSTSLRVAMHAACPVVVVPTAPVDAPSARRVLVGTDASVLSDPAVGFAFEEADLRHLPLTAVLTWTAPGRSKPGDMQPLVYNADEVADEERRLLAESLSGWSATYPDVAVTQRVVHAPAGRTLVRMAHDADILIVGARGRGAVEALLLGSVSRHVLHHAAGPVAVVRSGRRFTRAVRIA